MEKYRKQMVVFNLIGAIAWATAAILMLTNTITVAGTLALTATFVATLYGENRARKLYNSTSE